MKALRSAAFALLTFVLYRVCETAAVLLWSAPSIVKEMTHLPSFSFDGGLEAVKTAVRQSEAYSIEISMLGGAILLLVLYLIVRSGKKKAVKCAEDGIFDLPVPSFFALRGIGAFDAVCSALIGVCGSFASDLFFRIPFPENWFALDREITSGYSSARPVSIVLGLILFIPFVEEIVFRGVIFSRLNDAIGPFLALLLSCTLFALIHGSPIQMLYAFLMGLTMAAALMKTRSVVSPVLIHICFNLVSGLDMLFETPWSRLGGDGTLCLSLCALGALTVLLCLLFLRKKHPIPTEYTERNE